MIDSITSQQFFILKKGVAYINVDGCVSGDMFDGEASAALKKVIVEAMKSTPYEENFQSGYRNQYQNSHSNYQNWDEDELMDSENTYYQYWKRKLGNDRVMNKNHNLSHFKDFNSVISSYIHVNDVSHIGIQGGYNDYIRDLISESDHTPFAFGVGMPSINIRFIDKIYNNSYVTEGVPLPDYPNLSFPGNYMS